MSSARKHKRRQEHRPIIDLQVSGPLYVLLAGLTPAEQDALVARALRKYTKEDQSPAPKVFSYAFKIPRYNKTLP